MVFSEDMIQKVWEKGRAVLDRAADEWRKDECGAWIHRAQYGNADSEYGWKIESVTAGLPNKLHDLRPFHWRNGFNIGNQKARCHVSADRGGLAPTQHVETPRNKNL